MNPRTFIKLAAAGANALGCRRTAAQNAPKARNVVLVHGLFADGSSWSEVIPKLQAKNIRITSVQNPLARPPAAVEATKRVLVLQDGPTVLDGHSSSGMIVTEAGVDPKVCALVYVAARAPDAGEDYAALAKGSPRLQRLLALSGPTIGEAETAGGMPAVLTTWSVSYSTHCG